LWYLPAYPPSIRYTLEDCALLEKEEYLPTELFDFLKTHNMDKIKETISAFDWPCKSYEHQLEGLATIIYNYRQGLRFDMGCGKTKIVVDQINFLKEKSLVTCPRVGLYNWKNEIEMFAPNLTCVVLDSSFSSKKMKEQLDLAVNADVVICTYGLTATTGVPHLKRNVLIDAKNHRLAPTPTITAELKKVSDAKLQLKWLTEWRNGRKIRDIRDEINNMNLGIQWISQLPYTQIVADESHRIKTNASQQTQACLKLAEKASRRILLSGTMSHGNVLDVYPQMKFMAKYTFDMNYTEYKKHFCISNKLNVNIVVGYKNIDHINRVINRYTIERKLEDCVDMPERTFITLEYTVSKQQKQDYNTLVEVGELNLEDELIVHCDNNAVKINKLLQICSGFLYINPEEDVCDTCDYTQVAFCVEHSVTPGTGLCKLKGKIPATQRITYYYKNNPKLERLDELLIDLLPNGKCIIWAVFQAELDYIENNLKTNNRGYVRVDGSTVDNSAAVKRFNTDPTCVVYLAQISTGIMITLNAAKYSIYYSRDYSLEHREQSLYRNYRINQDKKTVVYDLCGSSTLEVQQMTALKNKVNTAELMTKKIDCAICNNYGDCLKNSTQPWENGCVLQSKVNKAITKARSIR
jgi:SNF2 family DNA or RNA helicase